MTWVVSPDVAPAVAGLPMPALYDGPSGRHAATWHRPCSSHGDGRADCPLLPTPCRIHLQEQSEVKHARYVVRRFLPVFPGRAGDRRRTRHRPGHRLALARAGADVAVADLDPQVAEETAAAIRSLGRRSLALGVDVSDGDSVRAMVERVATEFGRLDVAVNNAGVISIRKVAELSLADWDRVMNVNARGVFLCCQAELPLMQAQRWGRIVNLSSIAGKVGLPTSPTTVPRSLP